MANASNLNMFRLHAGKEPNFLTIFNLPVPKPKAKPKPKNKKKKNEEEVGEETVSPNAPVEETVSPNAPVEETVSPNAPVPSPLDEFDERIQTAIRQHRDRIFVQKVDRLKLQDLLQQSGLVAFNPLMSGSLRGLKKSNYAPTLTMAGRILSAGSCEPANFPEIVAESTEYMALLQRVDQQRAASSSSSSTINNDAASLSPEEKQALFLYGNYVRTIEGKPRPEKTSEDLHPTLKLLHSSNHFDWSTMQIRGLCTFSLGYTRILADSKAKHAPPDPTQPLVIKFLGVSEDREIHIQAEEGTGTKTWSWIWKERLDLGKYRLLYELLLWAKKSHIFWVAVKPSLAEDQSCFYQSAGFRCVSEKKRQADASPSMRFPFSSLKNEDEALSWKVPDGFLVVHIKYWDGKSFPVFWPGLQKNYTFVDVENKCYICSEEHAPTDEDCSKTDKTYRNRMLQRLAEATRSKTKTKEEETRRDKKGRRGKRGIDQ